LQDEFKSFILIADIQALTDNFKQPEQVKLNVLELLKDYLSVGIDPTKSSICLQSKLTGLLELTQYLSNLTSIDQLKHNPTLKTEIIQKKINNLSFFSYPVSQAADILAFSADVVPVGGDQSPIIELTNKLAKYFNQTYKHDYLRTVKALFSDCPRLKGTDGDNKMSKSLNNAIFLKDSTDEIRKKVYKMYTDPLHVRVEDPGHLENNVVAYFLDIFDPNQKELLELKTRYTEGGVADILLKNRLVDILDAKLSPIRDIRASLDNDEQYLKEVLKKGTDEATIQIEKTLIQVRKNFCFLD
jgi:tryptophanyl-tRNA synthetase